MKCCRKCGRDAEGYIRVKKVIYVLCAECRRLVKGEK